MKKIFILIGIVIIIAVAWNVSRASDHATSPHASSPASSSPSSPQPFNKHEFSTTDPASLWVVINKKHPLTPKTYVPRLTVPHVKLKGNPGAENMHVSTVMAPSLEQLFAGAQQAGYTLMLSSGYRSYNYQVSVYGQIVSSKGQNQADQESARPGYSEHQTGLAADVAPASGKCDLSQCFGTTPEGQWLAANAYKYGFVIRYPQGKEAVTGYEYEPWHLRFVGTDLSTRMHDQGVQTLEEFFGVTGGESYN